MENTYFMNITEAREHILALATTLKLTEKAIRPLEDEAAKWEDRARLARSREMADLAGEAEREAEKINTRLEELRKEEGSIKSEIEAIRRELPGLAARERSIDPLLLEQELLAALGKSEEEAETDRAFRKLENEHAAQEALEAMKAGMKEPQGRKDIP